MIRNEPLVSIITPVFNGQLFIEETLKSIVHSTYQNLEIILVDDGSTDDSLSIAYRVLSNSGRAHQIFTKPNSGEAESDNFGLSKASGAYIAFISADDPVHKNLIRESIKVLETHPEVVVTYPNWKKIDERGEEIEAVEPEQFSIAALVGDMLCLPGPGAVIRRSAFKGDMARRPEYRYISDYRQWLDLACVGSFKKIEKCLASWRIHSNQQTNTASARALSDELQRIMPEFFSQPGVPSSIRKYKNQAIATGFYRAALQSLISPNVPGYSLVLRSFGTFFTRDCYLQSRRKPLRRSPYTLLAIFLAPLKRAYRNN